MQHSEEKQARLPPLLYGEDQTAIDFIRQEQKESCLKECACVTQLNRSSNPHNARSYIDNLCVKLFDSKKWPRERPIQVVDVAAGDLLQLATVVTSLVNAGYKVGVSLMDLDLSVVNSVQASTSKEGAKERVLSDFNQLITILNSKTKPGTVVLNGVFSHVDSYLATVQGDAPLQYERIPAREIRVRVRNGAKRRYINPDLRTSDEIEKGKISPLIGKEEAKNKKFAEEFKQACKDKTPDLILTVDDISNFFPVLLAGSGESSAEGKTDRHNYMNSPYSDYAYKKEVIDPIQKLNPEAIFVGTLKKAGDNLELHVTHQHGIVVQSVGISGQQEPAQVIASLKEQAETKRNESAGISGQQKPTQAMASLKGQAETKQNEEKELMTELINEIKAAIQTLTVEIDVLETQSEKSCFTFFINREKSTKQQKQAALQGLLNAGTLDQLHAQAQSLLQDKSNRIHRAGTNTVTGTKGKSRTTELLKKIVDSSPGSIPHQNRS